MSDDRLMRIKAQMLALSPRERTELYALAVASGAISPRLLTALHALCRPMAGPTIGEQRSTSEGG